MNNYKVYITSMGVVIGNKTNSGQKEFKIEAVQYEPMLACFQTRNIDRISKILLSAANTALIRRNVVEPNFKIKKGENNDYGVILGSQFSALDSIHQYDMEALEKGALAVNPGLFPNTVLNSPACQVSIQCSFAGPVYTVCNGLTSSLDAIGIGYNFVRTGLSSMLLAGGADEVAELQIMMKRSDQNLGEAGGFLMLESEKTITGNEKLAEIIGYQSKVLSKEQKGSLFETVSNLIIDVTASEENNMTDVKNISVGSVFHSCESENILSGICKNIYFSGNRECVKINWMGACGIVQASKALGNIGTRNGKSVMWVLINIDQEKVAVLALKSI